MNLLERNAFLDREAKRACLFAHAPSDGRVRFGGAPLAAQPKVWPRNGLGQALSFLAEIDCAALPEGMSRLTPADGILLFFGDLSPDARAQRRFCVEYLSPGARGESAPARLVSKILRPVAVFSYPDPVAYNIYGETTLAIRALAAERLAEELAAEGAPSPLPIARHQMLGAPAWAPGGEAMHGKAMLLLQIDHDPLLATPWAAGAMVQFWISAEDLGARRFEGAIGTLQ